MKRLLMLALLGCVLVPSAAFAAVAFDNATTSSASLSAGGTLSRSLSLAGSNLTLIAWTVAGNTNVTDVQYNGVSMTNLREETLSGNVYELWVLKAPATGANNFTINGSAFLNVGYSFASYSGTDQTAGVLDKTSAGVQSAATSHSQSMTPNVDNAMHVGVACSSAQQAASTATTRRSTATSMVGGPGTCGVFESGPITPIGSNSLNETSASASVVFQDVSISPFVVSEPPVRTATPIWWGNW